jgi:hypothetical protein
MNLDPKKTSPTPKDKWEAIEFANTAQQKLCDVLHIMHSALENNNEDDKVYHETKMKQFIEQFEV